MARIEKSVDMLMERFDNTGKSVLVVGHGLAGGRMIEMLIGDTPTGRLHPFNAHISHLQKTTDGKFKLIEYNLSPEAKEGE